MSKFYWLLILFILGGFLFFPQASWGWILLLLDVGILLVGQKRRKIRCCSASAAWAV